MERGENSNIEYKYTRIAHTSGIVIRDGWCAPTAVVPTVNIPPGEMNREQHAATFKREAGQYMPIANTTRIMRRVLLTHAKIADDAKEAIQECVSEFISLITAEANGRCSRDYRKTVTPEDVLAAMASLGFNDYVEPLSVFLNKHRTKDPERGSTSPQLPQFVQREGGRSVHQSQAAQMVLPPQPPPQVATMPTVGYYTPLSSAVANTIEDEGEFGGFAQAINEYILCNHGGREGSSVGSEFTIFQKF